MTPRNAVRPIHQRFKTFGRSLFATLALAWRRFNEVDGRVCQYGL
jgi:hypothetical protein